MVTSDPKEERPSDVPETAETSGDSGRSHGALLRVGALGINAWAVAVALPTHAGGVYGLSDLVLAMLPLAALSLGLRAMSRSGESALGLLAVGVPVLLVTAIAGRMDPALSDRYGTATTILSALSMLAYVIATADALGRPVALRITRESKLAQAARARPASRGLRALVLGTTSTVALLMAIVLPALGSRASAAEVWGEAADEGRVLTAIVGATIACITTGAIVGPALRAERRAPPSPRETISALGVSLAVAAIGAVIWAVLRSLE